MGEGAASENAHLNTLRFAWACNFSLQKLHARAGEEGITADEGILLGTARVLRAGGLVQRLWGLRPWPLSLPGCWGLIQMPMQAVPGSPSSELTGCCIVVLSQTGRSCRQGK